MTDGERLSFLADVHVPRAVVHALTGSGLKVSTGPDATRDRALLKRAAESSDVLLTNDRDFADLHESVDHGGIVIDMTTPGSAAAFLREIRRIDR